MSGRFEEGTFLAPAEIPTSDNASQKTSHYTTSSKKKHVAGMYTKCEQALPGLKNERQSLKCTVRYKPNC
jgi:hypothetical protein